MPTTWCSVSPPITTPEPTSKNWPEVSKWLWRVWKCSAKAPSCCSPSDAGPLGPARHDHRYPRRLHHRHTDRTKQHPGETAPAMTADNHQLCGVRLLDQLVGGPITHHHAAHGDVGITFLPTCQLLRQYSLPVVLHGGDIDSGHVEYVSVVPGVYGDEFHAAERGFGEGHRSRDV